MQTLKFPSIIVASSDDPYGNLIFAQSCAIAWSSHFVNIGAAGHINTASGLGSWHDGFALYHQLAA
jgi:predicted alpha/beta hydrolase family esterase